MFPTYFIFSGNIFGILVCFLKYSVAKVLPDSVAGADFSGARNHGPGSSCVSFGSNMIASEAGSFFF
ncbi:hypothetical protein AD929_13930 [Gluconobacter potus]|uniref:Uncharacterized protein n=1 Tax=Gluconobacter potus TaxID=2724927 RepID=A0A149QRW3_9PROT|nr:hypothetical protein AD929_13930 [Gluconobacter potus]